MLAVADPKEQKRMEIMRLKRRFLKDRNVTSAFYAKSQSRQKIQREVDSHIHCSLFPHLSVLGFGGNFPSDTPGKKSNSNYHQIPIVKIYSGHCLPSCMYSVSECSRLKMKVGRYVCVCSQL